MPASAAIGLFAVIVIGAQGWARASARLEAELPSRVALPQVAGWTQVSAAPHLEWTPQAQGAQHRLYGRYRDAAGRTLDLVVAVYAAQDEGREAGGFGQGALPPGGAWSWHGPGPALDGGKSEVLRGDNGDLRLAVTWYGQGETATGSNVRLKLLVMQDRLKLQARPTMLLIVSSVDASPRTSARTIAAFMHASGNARQWMDRMTAVE